MLLLENVRFYKEEEKNDVVFAKDVRGSNLTLTLTLTLILNLTPALLHACQEFHALRNMLLVPSFDPCCTGFASMSTCMRAGARRHLNLSKGVWCYVCTGLRLCST